MITVQLPYPISANRYWATRVITPKGQKFAQAMTYVTPEAKAFKEQVAWIVKAAGHQPIVGRAAVTIQLYPHRPLDYRTRMKKHGDAWDDTVRCIDLDNANKVVLDALKNVLFQDDEWLHDIHLRRMEPDGEARVVVTVRPYVRSVAGEQGSLLEAA